MNTLPLKVDISSVVPSNMGKVSVGSYTDLVGVHVESRIARPTPRMDRKTRVVPADHDILTSDSVLCFFKLYIPAIDLTTLNNQIHIVTQRKLSCQ